MSKNETGDLRLLLVTERERISREKLKRLAAETFGQLIKAVVDLEKEAMVINGEFHADEEALLLTTGSKQENLWGINLYPSITDKTWVEFDSMINLRPSLGNRSREIEDSKIRRRIIETVDRLVEK